jgi:hypothetical protein
VKRPKQKLTKTSSVKQILLFPQNSNCFLEPVAITFTLQKLSKLTTLVLLKELTILRQGTKVMLP